VRLWETATGRPVASFGIHDSLWAVDLAFSPDGGRLASVAYGTWSGGEVNLWDMRSGSRLASFAQRGLAHAVAFAPDGRGLSVGVWWGNKDGGSLSLWDPFTGRTRLLGHLPAGPGSMRFSADGALLAMSAWPDEASGLSGHQIRLFELATGRVTTFPEGHTK